MSPIGCPIGCPVRDGWGLYPVTVAPQSRPLHDCRPSAMLSHPVTVAPSVTPSTHFTHFIPSHALLNPNGNPNGNPSSLRRSVSLAEALYVNEGTVSPSSLHSALHSLSHLAHFLPLLFASFAS